LAFNSIRCVIGIFASFDAGSIWKPKQGDFVSLFPFVGGDLCGRNIEASSIGGEYLRGQSGEYNDVVISPLIIGFGIAFALKKGGVLHKVESISGRIDDKKAL